MPKCENRFNNAINFHRLFSISDWFAKFFENLCGKNNDNKENCPNM